MDFNFTEFPAYLVVQVSDLKLLSTAVGATNSSICTPCAAGTYSTATGATSSSTCLACSPGSYSLAGSSSCSFQCQAGTYSAGGSSGVSFQYVSANDLRSNDICSFEAVTSPTACASLCYSCSGCIGFVYRASDGGCFRKSSITTQQTVASGFQLYRISCISCGAGE